MSKCPKCSTEMVIIKRIKEIEGPPITGGYFGERPEEYAVTPSGHTLGTTSVLFYKCPNCGYEEEKK